MSNKKIDLSDIKENDLDKTSSFSDLMTRSERKKRKEAKLENQILEVNDIEEMIEEKRKSTKDLTKELKNIKDYDNEKKKNDGEDTLGKTQILELTRQMKFNLEETKLENKKKKGVSILNVIGEVNLLCIGYYIYLLVFTNYQDEQSNYLINGGLIILLVLLFGMSVVTNKTVRKVFNILNVLALLSFIIFNAYTLFC